MIDTLSALDGIQIPGTIRELDYRWADDDSWKDRVMRPDPQSSRHTDDRQPRNPIPQYQLEADRRALETNGGECATCVFLED